MDAGIAAVDKAYGAALETWVIIPRPHENVVAVLPIDFNEDVEEYRAAAEGFTLPRY
jgi:microcompartment protein CcmL/EutN